LIYDITNPASLETLDHFMDLIHMEAEQRVEDNQRLRKVSDAMGTPPPVKIVAGNKCDLKEGRVVTSREGLEYARKHGCGFMETSAREMVNIEETFARTITSRCQWMALILSSLDLVRRVVEARRLHDDALNPRAEPRITATATSTALPPTSVDATEPRSRRSRAWAWAWKQYRKRTEPDERDQAPPLKRKCQGCCACQLCLPCGRGK
jgi:hypothetical protein